MRRVILEPEMPPLYTKQVCIHPQYFRPAHLLFDDLQSHSKSTPFLISCCGEDCTGTSASHPTCMQYENRSIPQNSLSFQTSGASKPRAMIR